jgi:hypothetical protein
VPVSDTNCWIYTYAWNPERPLTETEREALLLIAKHDRAPMRAVSLLEQARSELQDYLDRTDRIDPAGLVEIGLRVK